MPGNSKSVGQAKVILLAIEDITERKETENVMEKPMKS